MERHKRTLIWESQAEEDLFAIGGYCEGRFGQATALRVMREYEDLAWTLSAQPKIGRLFKEYSHQGMETRVFPYSWCLVYYCYSSTECRILRIFDTRLYPDTPKP